MHTVAEGAPSPLNHLFSRRAREIYSEMLSRTGSRSLASELCREAFLRVKKASKGLDPEQLDALLTRSAEDAYLTYRDLSLLHEELFSPAEGGSFPPLDTEPEPPLTEEVFSPPFAPKPSPAAEPSPDRERSVPESSPVPEDSAPEPSPAPERPGPNPAPALEYPDPEPSSAAEDPAVGAPPVFSVKTPPPAAGAPAPADFAPAKPEPKPTSLIYDFQKEEVTSYFSAEPSASMTLPKKGSRLAIRLLLPFLLLFSLLFLWLLAGLLMSLGIIPFFDLGYLWFNSHIFRLF